MEKCKSTNMPSYSIKRVLRSSVLSKDAIAIQQGMMRRVIPISEIVYLEAASNYTEIVTACEEKVLAAKTLKHFEEILTEKGFIRCHNSFIVNRKSIYGIKNQQTLIMKYGKELKLIPISRRQIYKIKEMFFYV